MRTFFVTLLVLLLAAGAGGGWYVYSGRYAIGADVPHSISNAGKGRLKAFLVVMAD